MGRLIDEDDVIAEIEHHKQFIMETQKQKYGNTDEIADLYFLAHDHIKEAIKAKVPSAQPEPQWNPCSERLPEEKGYYWTVHSYMSGHIDYYVSRFAKDLYKVDEYDFAEWKGVSGFFTIDAEYGYIKMDALAWMPIEPWRGEE